WFCWPIFVLLIPYVILVTIGVLVIQYALPWCTTETAGGRETTDESECAGYEAAWALVLAIAMGIIFCCCFCGVRSSLPHWRNTKATETSLPYDSQL
ncbi:unnamed protein product, partial [Ectocarpus sp. 12 AP-2014]